MTILLIILLILGWKFEVSFDYVEKERLFLIFYSAKNRERKCVKIKL